VASVGIRSWLLKPLNERLTQLDAEIKKVNDRIDNLELQVMDLKARFDDKADKERLRLIERELEQVENLTKYLFDTLRDLQRYAMSEIEGSSSEPRENQKSEEEVIIELIRQGYDSPKNLAKKAKIGVGRMYEILERLEKENRVRTIKKGRKRKIIVIEE